MTINWSSWPWGLPPGPEGVSDVRSARPSRNDVELIHLAYSVVATESQCERCSKPLRRSVALDTPEATASPPSWSLVVTTRCHGWRRHKHYARVEERSGDLVLGRFRR